MYLLILLILTINNFNGNLQMQFMCNSGVALKNISFICNGHRDCFDGSDETHELCHRILCPAIDTFKCNYGACIKKHYKCNGIENCADGSDEIQCGRKFNSCRLNEYRCKQTGECIPSADICDGHNDCKDASDESSEICLHNYLCLSSAFRCNYGACIPNGLQCNGVTDCLDGSDESAVLCLAHDCPKCRETIKCKPFKLNGQRIDVLCKLNNIQISCYEPIPPGTHAIYSCREYFRPANTNKHKTNYESHCQLDGTWSNELLECIPNCGKLSSAIPLIVNGWEPTKSFPWHGHIYVNINQLYRFWCGATLISEAVFITAAHCLWHIHVNQIIIALGNVRHPMLLHGNNMNITDDKNDNDNDNDNNDDDEIFEERRLYSVKRKIIHPLYLDKYGNYGSDIALIEINGNVAFNDFVQPICIDWELDDITSHLNDTSIGYIMGMGITETDGFSDQLRVTSLPVVSNRKCLKRQRADFRKFITFTTFCAGWENGTSVCNGDSGGGLAFLKSSTDQWCLQGIVSLSPRRTSTTFCDPQQYTIFTKVGIYVKWIKNILREVHSHHNFTYNNEYDPIF